MGSQTWRAMEDVTNILGLEDVGQVTSEAIQSQYAASPRMGAVCHWLQYTIDGSRDMDTMFDNLLWIPTATGVSLDIWGRIVAIDRSLLTESGQITWGDEAYRILILYKALANISSSDAATLNELLTQLFGNTVYVLDNGDMTMRVVFEFYADENEEAILRNYGLLCRGGGVGWEWYQIDPDQTFGFDGSELHPFNQAAFAKYDVVTQS